MNVNFSDQGAVVPYIAASPQWQQRGTENIAASPQWQLCGTENTAVSPQWQQCGTENTAASPQWQHCCSKNSAIGANAAAHLMAISTRVVGLLKYSRIIWQYFARPMQRIISGMSLIRYLESNVMQSNVMHCSAIY